MHRIAAVIVVICAVVASPVFAQEGSAAGQSPPRAIELFNGKDFAGWVRYLPNAADPDTIWEVRDGVVYCSGAIPGYMRTAATYGDYRLTLEWRWASGKGGNSGVLLHISGEDQVWPKSIEAQLAHENAGDFWVIGGTDFKEHVRKEERHVPKAQRHNEKALGEWNSMDIVCSGGSIRVTVNGQLQNVATEATVREGYIGLQSEGAPIEFRRIRLEPIRQESAARPAAASAGSASK